MLKKRFQVSRARSFSALGALAVVAACGSTKTNVSDGGGAGGTGAESGWTYLPPGSSSGGTGSSSGGTLGHAGISSAGSAGTVTTPVTFKCGGKQPDQPIVTSFDDFKQDRWKSPGNLDGGVYVYPATHELAAGDFLRFADQVSTYTGIGVWFSGCIDASKFTGVRFTISGDVGASGNVKFYVVSNRDKYVDEPNGIGACVPADPVNFWPTCHPPGLVLPVGAEPTTVSIPWTALKDGLPATTTDGSDVLALEWAFNWQEGGNPYAASLTIDDIELYSEESSGGAGGAGGMGGAGGAPPDVGNDGGVGGT